MITKKTFQFAQKTAKDLLLKTGIRIKDSEFSQISVADFGLSDLNTFGAQILTLVNTNLIAIKLIAMQPFQIIPEHWHPKIGEYSGKEETLRVEWGELFLYRPGEPVKNPRAIVPKEKLECFKHWNELCLLPGDQITLPPTNPHWFQAGSDGVVVWSFSTKALDLQDEFTDPQICRETIISEKAENY